MRQYNNMLTEMHNTYEHTRAGADAAAAVSQAPIWYRYKHFLVALEPYGEAAKKVACGWRSIVPFY